MEKKGRKYNAEVVDNDDELCSVLVHRGVMASFVCVAMFGLLVRAAVSLHLYSGACNPPKFGDYEAQRHWMEITINLPVKEWYHNSTMNDLSYWGLDYPPLTAYQSYIHGLFLKYFHPESVALSSSRGHESYFGKLLLRWTVLSSDALIFFPAALYFVLVYYGNHPVSIGHKSNILWHITIILINPCLILIDHGHFQYNCISLGLVIGAAAAVLSKNDLVSCVLFCLSLNHKQMSAYFAPAFFSHLLGKCLRRNKPLIEVSKLGLMVLGTFSVVWWPYLHSKDAILEVLLRLAPFDRGIYEDYVANFWCTTSVFIKWKRLFSTPSLKLLSLAATLLSCLPSMVQQIMHPSLKGFLYGLLNSAFSFYLFSFQVHEKSILLPLLPAALLATELDRSFKFFMHYALFSMFPLIYRDNLILPYAALYGVFILLYLGPSRRKNSEKYPSAPLTALSIALTFLYLFSIVLHIIYLTVSPPEKYPFLFEAIIMLLCFFHFVLFALYTNAKQWMLSTRLSSRDKGRKEN
ncbi:hypothetical protein K2173_013996 [Erythroxylum novogranatense]|uniref:Alpha-1,3-glucosyltransferase n=1 Tax=Erythroxylum novogranatense TaxID=1862640 RepID=A0AAV8SCY8_9ROSI|nr:hypothetical protein K2173_013996 [Erythroxylum novogranatense]